MMQSMMCMCTRQKNYIVYSYAVNAASVRID